MRVRNPSGRISKDSCTLSCVPASASRRSTANWMSSRSSNPRSSRSATPPSTSRNTGSQPRSVGVCSAIRSGRICDLLCGNQSVADDAVSGQEAGHLSGRGGHEGLVQHDLDSGVYARGKVGRQLARNRLRAVAKLYMVNLFSAAVQLNSFDKEAVDCKRFLRSDGHVSCVGILADDVKRAPAGDSNAAALADREAVEAFVLGQNGAIERDHLSALRLPL